MVAEFRDVHILRVEKRMKERLKKLTPSQEAFKEILYKRCISRCNRPKAVKVEICPPGIAIGAVDTFIEKHTIGWSRTFGLIGVGAESSYRQRLKGIK